MIKLSQKRQLHEWTDCIIVLWSRNSCVTYMVTAREKSYTKPKESGFCWCRYIYIHIIHVQGPYCVYKIYFYYHLKYPSWNNSLDSIGFCWFWLTHVCCNCIHWKCMHSWGGKKNKNKIEVKIKIAIYKRMKHIIHWSNVLSVNSMLSIYYYELPFLPNLHITSLWTFFESPLFSKHPSFMNTRFFVVRLQYSIKTIWIPIYHTYITKTSRNLAKYWCRPCC